MMRLLLQEDKQTSFEHMKAELSNEFGLIDFNSFEKVSIREEILLIRPHTNISLFLTLYTQLNNAWYGQVLDLINPPDRKPQLTIKEIATNQVTYLVQTGNARTTVELALWSQLIDDEPAKMRKLVPALQDSPLKMESLAINSAIRLILQIDPAGEDLAQVISPLPHCH